MAGVLAAVAALAVLLGASFALTGAAPRRGCVTLSLAYSTGGEVIERCGAAAARLCASRSARAGVGVAGGAGAAGSASGAGRVAGPQARALARACRRAHLPSA